MLQALTRRGRSSKRQQLATAKESAVVPEAAPPEEYRSFAPSLSTALRTRLKDCYSALRPRDLELDVTSTLEEDYDDDDDDDSVSVCSSACSLLYSDNEDEERDFQQHRTQLKRQSSSASSVQSNASTVRSKASSVRSGKRSIASSVLSYNSRRKSRRKQNKKNEKQQDKKKAGYDALVEESAPPICSTVEILGAAGADHYGGVTDLDDILDAFARQRDPERPKILIPAATTNNQRTGVVEEDEISTSSSVMSRARRKIAKVFKKKNRKSSKKSSACNGDGDCSTSTEVDDLDSLLARYRGQSFTTVDSTSNKQASEQRTAVTSHRSLGSGTSLSFLPRPLCSGQSVRSAKARQNIVIHPSHTSSKDEEDVDPADAPAEGCGYDCDTGSVAAGENLGDYKVLKPSEQRKFSSSKPSPICERASRVTKRRPVIDPLDIERLLNKSDSEEEVIVFERSNDGDSSTVSSLTSDSSLTLSSSSPTSIMDESFNNSYHKSNARTANGKKKNLLDPAFGKHYSALPASRRLFKDAPPPPQQHAKPITVHKTEAPSAYNIPSTMQVKSHCSISILLIEPKRKIFEIVSVDISRGTPIGAVLEKACQRADDVNIKRQTYIGLCNTTEATMDMKLPILKFLPSLNDRQKKKERFLSEDEQMKREMERRLLVAVPNKATARECIKIRGLLWRNPKLQTWWHNSAPLCRLGFA